jgi:hypothetical protein
MRLLIDECIDERSRNLFPDMTVKPFGMRSSPVSRMESCCSLQRLLGSKRW